MEGLHTHILLCENVQIFKTFFIFLFYFFQSRKACEVLSQQQEQYVVIGAALDFNERDMSFWPNFHHWLHQKSDNLSEWQLMVQLVMKI